MKFVSLACIAIFCGMLLSGCGHRDGTVDYPEDFWTQNDDALAMKLESYYRAKGFKHIVHIFFAGNDFGLYKSLETQINISEGKVREGVFPDNSLQADQGALGIETHYDDQSILASIMYRHKSAKKANAAFRDLFGCADGNSEKIKETLLVGSGGSHGAYELQIFAKQLKKDCGKKLDLVILGDAIAQPGPFPMFSFTGQESDAMCLHFYQNRWKTVLSGAPMKNCKNIRVRKMNHFGEDGLARFPSYFVEAILHNLNTSEKGLGLLSKKNLFQQRFETSAALSP